MPIRQRLFVVFSTALLAMILLLSGYTILTVQRYLEGEALLRMKTLARDLTQRVQNDPPSALSLARESVFLNGYELLFLPYPDLPVGRAFPRDSIPEQALEVTGTGGGLFSFTDDAWIYVVSPWRLPDARLVVRQKRSDVGAALRPIRHIIYTGMLFSLVLIAAVSGFTSRSLARPIRQIAEAAEAIAAGDRSRSLSLDRKDEFGRMAASLNRMAERLQKESDVQRELNRRLRDFHSDLAHEIRNPLHAMNSALELLALPDLPPESRTRYEGVVQVQSARLNRLVNDLLTLQKFDGSEAPALERSDVDLGQLAGHVFDLHREAAAAAGNRLDIPEQLPVVRAHPGRLEQVLENLVSNAVKFTANGRIAIEAEVRNGEVTVHVRDTGAGIPADAADRIFDRFYRVDSSRNRETGGAGLGLAVVRSLLRAQGSEIFVNSVEGRGSDFYFRLPLAEPAAS